MRFALFSSFLLYLAVQRRKGNLDIFLTIHIAWRRFIFGLKFPTPVLWSCGKFEWWEDTGAKLTDVIKDGGLDVHAGSSGNRNAYFRIYKYSVEESTKWLLVSIARVLNALNFHYSLN